MASFLKTARRSEPGTAAEIVVPPPPTERWAPALLAAAAELTGSEPTFAEDPAALPHGFGPWAFGLRLGDDPIGLTVRLATDRAELEREVAAMERSRAHGCAAPTVRGIVALDPEQGAADGSSVSWALLTDVVDAVGLPELIGFNLHHSTELLDGFAAHHDAIHRLPIDDLLDHSAIPVIDAPTEVARIDADRYPAERAWLDEHVAPSGTPVLCHGGYQPLAVFGPPAEAWPDHGGPGHGLTVVNWAGAVLAEPELDMAFTLVAFWSAPFFAPNRSERTAIKMIRNTLLSTYKQGYTARRQIDPDRLRFWQAFHALRGMARIDGAYDADGSPFAAADRGAVPTDLGPELHRHFRQLTRVR